jgi:hypothetical protein
LQLRPKWNKRERNLAIGDLVLIKDKESHRNNWPTGKVTEPIVSEDGNVRKANVLVCSGGNRKIYLRPISELVLILPAQDNNNYLMCGALPLKLCNWAIYSTVLS